MQELSLLLHQVTGSEPPGCPWLCCVQSCRQQVGMSMVLRDAPVPSEAGGEGATWKEPVLKLSPSYTVRGLVGPSASPFRCCRRKQSPLILEGRMGEGECVPWRAGGHTPCFPSSVLAELPQWVSLILDFLVQHPIHCTCAPNSAGAQVSP